MATEYWSYLNYTGLSNPTFQVKFVGTSSTNGYSEYSGYEYPDQSGSGISTNTFYTIGSGRQFFWIAARYSEFPANRMATTSATDVSFTIRISDGGTNYDRSPVWTEGILVSAVIGQLL